MKRTYRFESVKRNPAKHSPYPVAVPQFASEQERLEWIKQQTDQATARALEAFRQRLAVVKQQSEKGSAS